mgnify:CR=1 FL=1
MKHNANKYNVFYPECPICFHPMTPNTSNKLTESCPHTFHKHCLEDWLLSHNNQRGMTCPICSCPIFIEKNIIKRPKIRCIIL